MHYPSGRAGIGISAPRSRALGRASRRFQRLDALTSSTRRYARAALAGFNGRELPPDPGIQRRIIMDARDATYLGDLPRRALDPQSCQAASHSAAPPDA